MTEQQAQSDVQRLPLVDSYIDSPEWHVRRFCQEDWLLHVRVYRIRNRQRYEIALFLAEDHWKFEKDSGVLGGLVFALSEAYHQVGRMEMYFVGPPYGDEPEIPHSIRRVAADRYGIVFQKPTKISDAEGRKLYERITGFREEVLILLGERGISHERACFVVQRAIWSREQVEFLARHGRCPDRIFRGGAPAECRLSYQADLVLLRIALMAERVRVMLETDAQQSEADVHMEWTGIPSVSYRPPCDAVLQVFSGVTLELAGQQSASALLAPRDAIGYMWHGLEDLPSSAPPPSPPTLVFVTKDIFHIPLSVRETLLAAADERNVAIVPIVDTLADLDTEIDRRLARAASTERTMPERPD